ncbi:MAG: ribonuclease R [Clostridia bacterium]
MDRKQKILLFMKSKEYVPLKFAEMAAVLDVPKADEPELLSLLNELSDEGKIYLTKKKRYVCTDSKAGTVVGKIRCNANGFFGFVICEEENEEDIFIPGEKLGDALDSDRVLIKLDNSSDKSRRREGHVIKVLEHNNKTIVGVIYKEKEGTFRMRPDNRQIYAKVRIKPEDMMSAKTGDRVACEIIEYAGNGKVWGKVISVLGEEKSLKGCIEGIILEHGIKQEFDADTLAEAENAPSLVTEADVRGREDLRDMMIFTIDGDDARDFDDAVSLSILNNGNYYLGVHIADVTNYVTDGSALDCEALERGTSVYLADRVIPMLPKKLSNGICSLNPDVDRLTLSVFMEVNTDGSVISHKLEKTVIRSKERMTYNNVNSILEDGDKELTEKYIHIVPTLKLMEELAKILRKKRDKRGAIQFDFPETEVVVDENGEPIEIVKVIRGTSQKLIEEFMLLANETIAEYAFWSELPFVYRVHEAPSTDKINEFNHFLRNFNLAIKGKIDDDNPIHPKALQVILDAVKDTPEERMVAAKMLRSLMKAEYKTENLGHFGLAAKYYCHFTSPIRRYPDLIIHRILKAFLDGQEIRSNVAVAASHSSDCEIAAEHTERDVEDLMKTAYMSKYIGEAFEGVISSVTGFGMFVELENSVEGLIRVENMEGDYFEFDENSNTLTGKRRGMTYKVGDIVRVVLARCDILLRQIDFVLEKDAGKKLLSKFRTEMKLPKKKNSHGKKKYLRRKKKR